MSNKRDANPIQRRLTRQSDVWLNCTHQPVTQRFVGKLACESEETNGLRAMGLYRQPEMISETNNDSFLDAGLNRRPGPSASSLS